MLKTFRFHDIMKVKCEETGKIYEYAGFGNANCPVCGRNIDWDYSDVEFVSKPHTVYFDSYDFEVFAKCKRCGKRYVYQDGN